MFSKVRIFSSISACSALVILAGCATYLEQRTPPGAVPPPLIITSYESEPNKIDKSVQPETEGTNKQNSVSQTNPSAPPTETLKGTMRRFREAYEEKGKPRMAIFLNRELSDEVREWRTDEREVRAYKDSNLAAEREAEESSVNEKTHDRGSSVYSQKHISLSKGRIAPDEIWMWKFEDGFLQPLLQTGVRVVDRATIMRLAAAESGQQGSAYSPITVKKIEIDALKDKADIFVEVLVTRNRSALHGYEFKATAKEVSTGILLANATSLNWDSRSREAKRIVATSRGYEIKKDITFPTVNELSCDLALDLMSSLADIWQQ